MTGTAVSKALLAPPANPRPAAAQTIVDVARRHGLSPLRQMREMWQLKRGAGRLESHEYYSSGVFDPQMTMAEKKTFVGKIGSWAINARLSPVQLTEVRAFVADKVMYTALLQQLGLPTTQTQAVVSRTRGFGDLPTLRSPADVLDFLRDKARHPLFAKPCSGAGSVGSALITGIDTRRGMLMLGNGHEVDLDGFAHEVVSDYPEGVILQSAIAQHKDMRAMTGDAVGTLRVVTLRDADGIAPLYTVWKVPSPSAMSDNFWQAGSMVAEIDDAGQVTRCKKGTGLNAEWVDSHPVSGLDFAGFQIPHWDKVRDVAVRGHALFPEFGIVGWDIAVARDGPVIIECNDNPYHTLYQLAAGRGILNADFAARFDAAADASGAMLEQRIKAFEAREGRKFKRR